MHLKFYIVSFFISLLAITNPFGNLAIFITLTNNRTDDERRRIAISASIAVAVILITTIWVGDFILEIFGISLPAFQVAGGLMITLIGLSMLNLKQNGAKTKDEHGLAENSESIAVVPLAMPIIAGPGAIATVLIMVENYHSFWDRARCSSVSLVVAAIIGIMFYFSPFFTKLLGKSGLRIATRVMGMILISIAITMAAKGVGTLFPGLLH